jgi:hypothetical protein
MRVGVISPYPSNAGNAASKVDSHARSSSTPFTILSPALHRLRLHRGSRTPSRMVVVRLA